MADDEPQQVLSSELESSPNSRRSIVKTVRDLDVDEPRVLREGLEFLVQVGLSDPADAVQVCRCLRLRDYYSHRRPFERLSQLLASHYEKDVVKSALGLLNSLLSGNLPDHYVDDIWAALERSNYHENLKFLMKQKKDDITPMLVRFLEHYLANLRREANLNFDTSVFRWQTLLEKLNKCSEPLSTYNASCFNTTLSQLALRCLVHFGEVYGDYYRRLLDENEESLATNYSVNMASVSIVNIILDVLVEASAGSGSFGGGGISENLFTLLISNNTSFYELFCIGMAVFDMTWKEKHATLLQFSSVLGEARERMTALVTKFSSVRLIKEASCLNRLLHPTDVPTQSKKKLEASSRELAMEFSEIVADILDIGRGNASGQTPRRPAMSGSSDSLRLSRQSSASSIGSSSSMPAPLIGTLRREPSVDTMSIASQQSRTDLNKNTHSGSAEGSAQLLASSEYEELVDSMRALQATADHVTFQWSYVPVDVIEYFVKALSFKGWMRHPELATLTVKFLESMINKDVDGITKFEEALKLLSRATSEPTFRPIVKLIRNNRTFPTTLAILNKFFQTKTKDKPRRRFLKELYRVDAMPILKSKVWTTNETVRDALVQFQTHLLGVADEPFNPSSNDHLTVLHDVWNMAFPNMPLGHLGQCQTELLGFFKAKSVDDLRGTRMLGLRHLLTFAETYPDIFQHLVLFPPPTEDDIFPVGDLGLALTDTLMEKFTKKDLILPVLFDKGLESLSEVYCIVYLWIVQEWRKNPSLKLAQLVDNGNNQLASVSARHKPVTIDELFSHIGISLDNLRMSWHKPRTRSFGVDRAQSNIVIAVGAGEPINLDGPTSPNIPRSSKLQKLLGKEVSKPEFEDLTQSGVAMRPGPDYLDAYLAEHEIAFRDREDALAKKIAKALEGSKEKKKKPKIGNSVSTAKLSEASVHSGSSDANASDDSVTKVLGGSKSKKVDSLMGTRLDLALKNLGVDGQSNSDPQANKELTKKRKNESKMQRDLAGITRKHKAFQKKLLDDLKDLVTGPS